MKAVPLFLILSLGLPGLADAQDPGRRLQLVSRRRQALQVVGGEGCLQGADRDRHEVDEQVDHYLDLMRDYTYVNLLQPLIALELEPEPVETKTTQEDVVIRPSEPSHGLLKIAKFLKISQNLNHQTVA